MSTLTSLETPTPSTQPVPQADIPRATYRFQFNHQWTFKQAIELVPYLSRLGISHCYASPILTARPGSLHGYDIINHQQLNPEIGTADEFRALAKALRDHGMGLILDIVPNHMGVGSDNGWWMDVLENGQSSRYATYFDIDWLPVKDELAGKVHLPVLGQPYGKVLEGGELQLRFDPANGQLTLHYYDQHWPINPQSYPLLLSYRRSILAHRLGADSSPYQEYLSILTALERLPSYTETDPDRMAERLREKTIARQRLANLCQAHPQVSTFIEENLVSFNAVDESPESRLRLHTLIEAQVYRLAYWQVASDEINYRRFFDVNALAGIRTEVPAVFQDTHRFIFDLIEEGLVQGLRIDHPDGLFDPTDYFRQLQWETLRRQKAEWPVPLPGDDTPAPRPLYVLAEKILAPYERLPDNWPLHGTSGYEFVNLVAGVLINRDHETAFTRIYHQFSPDSRGFGEEVYRCKQLIMRVALASELNVLANMLNRISESDWNTRDFTLGTLRYALRDIVASFPVYRTYVTPGQVSKKDREYINWAVNLAKKRSRAADLTVYDFIRQVLLLEAGADRHEAHRQAIARFVQKFQQFTGPVMAKSLEDTAFYRYNRLVALNEVGGAPETFGLSVAAFHYQNEERARQWPHTMLATSTHDTKRSEDVRARLCALSELPDEWEACLARWSRLNQSKKREVDGQTAPSANDEYLIYQALLGVFPVEPLTVETATSLAERLKAYLIKATREAKVLTSWINPNTEYENALCQFIDGLLVLGEQGLFLEEFKPFAYKVAHLGMLNSLTQTVLKLTVPGVPDLYQGTELWDWSLVDPDNRRPVNYGVRQHLRQTLEPLLSCHNSLDCEQRTAQLAELLTHWPYGRIKLYLTMALLRLRSQFPHLFAQGDYQALDVSGARADHVIAFSRQAADETGQTQYLVVVVSRLPGTLYQGADGPLTQPDWQETAIGLKDDMPHQWLDVLTGQPITLEHSTMAARELFKTLPVAVLFHQG